MPKSQKPTQQVGNNSELKLKKIWKNPRSSKFLLLHQSRLHGRSLLGQLITGIYSRSKSKSDQWQERWDYSDTGQFYRDLHSVVGYKIK